MGDEAAKDNSINTASGINSALKSANSKNERKNGLALSVGQEESGWRKKSQLEPEAADENVPMQSRHVVRAYADVDAGDDLNVSVGPELILKDEQRERAAANKQPDSALGMGMSPSVPELISSPSSTLRGSLALSRNARKRILGA